MVSKEKLHLGQVVLYGAERERAVVDALTQSGIGLVLNGHRYLIGDYEDVYE